MFPLKDANPSITFPFVTWLLVLVNVGIFLFEISLPKASLDALVHTYGVIPDRLLADPGALELTTLLTAMFLHAGWSHLISNMWALIIFGDNIEDKLGHFRFVVFYLLCGLIAATVQVLAGPLKSMPTIGASGAIAGVLGAYALIFPGARVTTLIPVGFIPFFIQIPAYFYLGLWFLMQLLPGFLSLHMPGIGQETEKVAFLAHVGGFVAGMILVKLLKRRETSGQEEERYVFLE